MNDFTTAFRAVVAQRAESVAMREGTNEVTYADLATLAGGYRDACLARGIRPGQVVVLRRERGIEATAAMIGILLAGGAYTVIGDDYPPQRLEAMFAALDVAFTIDVNFVARQGNPGAEGDVARGPEALMYVIFTSGTTSVPKAVGVPDRAVLRLLGDPRLGLAAGKRITHVSPIEFDASVVELWGGLLAGMTVVAVSSKQVIDPFVMFELIEHGADVMWLTTSLFNFFVDKRPQAFAGLERVIVGGEALSLHHVNKALPHVTVVNGYGPTENTVFTTLDVMTGPSVDHISIGTAVAGTELAVRGPDGQRASEGELLAFGDGLAVGYLNDPDKNAAAFVEFEGRRAYRTGDMVALRPDGRLDFHGRIDSQVKVNGYRIDLQEIENALLECGAGTAKVLVDDGRIVAAVTEGGEGLRAGIADYLPAYMQPRQILLVDSIPVTANGKADVKALVLMRPASSPATSVAPVSARGSCVPTPRAPGLTATGPAGQVPARGDEAMTVRSIVADQLGEGLVDGVDNLFELGYDSIRLWKLVNAVNDAFGARLTLFDVLGDPTISTLEALVAPRAA